ALLPSGVEVILGVNGYVWIAPPSPVLQTPEDEARVLAQQLEQQVAAEAREISPELRQRIARVHNALLLLRQHFVAVFAASIHAVYAESERLQLPVADMLSPALADTLLAPARALLLDSAGM